ncbi:MAG: hydroxylamine reductase [Desulfovibrionaceae bacterium]
MFCYQCEQTAKGQGCTKIGVCGKQPDVAALQDLLVHLLKGLSVAAVAADEGGLEADPSVDRFIMEAMFSTLTNVNFDPERFPPLIHQAAGLRDRLLDALRNAKCAVPQGAAVSLQPAQDLAELVEQGEACGIEQDPEPDEDIKSLKWTVIFGLKGIAAYADHARILGKTDPEVDRFVKRALAAATRSDMNLEDWIGMALKTGEANLKAMAALDDANTSAYGPPAPTMVPLGPKAGKAILVSGHDLKDLAMLLEQTAGKGINVYTHGEMLPCHGYPALNKHPHFHGHYGTAWQNQLKEFAAFPGAILMTTNCIQKPGKAYAGNIFTTGLVGWPGVEHISAEADGSKDFTPVIQRALELPGFAADEAKGSVMVGFAHGAVLSVADKVIEAVKAGAVRHFFLVAGCDGAKPGRNYYTEFVEKVPKDCIVLTLACGKFRFFDKDLGDIGGIPRLLDVGQCNDAYSAIRIATALAEAFECSVNDLPLSMVLSWYEQKAVAILLTLLHLGVKDIRLGPSLPAFLSPNVLDFLVKTFDIKPISTPDEDLKAILG